ncbi:MAG TPA: hypothetical protein DCS93_27840 [Microscillaceae bacterium]|nr:hypothetical protein [Microscillaceae bacterium]
MKNTSLINRRKWLRNTALSSAGLVMAANAGAFAHDHYLQESFTEQELLRLFSNENPYSPSPKVKSAIQSLVHRANRYANYHRVNPNALKKAIAKREGLQPENIVLGHGSYQVLTLIAIMYGKNKETIITPKPTFNVVGRYADHQMGANVKYIALDKNHRMDLSAMRNAMDANTSLVFVCNPNNPTGTVIETERLKRFCKEVGKKATVLVDEAYIEYANPAKTKTMVELVQQKENVLITRTFSKMYGLAGMRIGYAMARKDIAEKLDKLNGQFGQLINTLGLGAAMAALEDKPFIRSSIKKNQQVMQYFCQQLDKMKLNYVPSETNFIYVQTGKAFKNFHSQLDKQKIKAIGKDSSEWSRISMATMADMKRLVKIMKNMKTK